jgi:hypothetical protein
VVRLHEPWQHPVPEENMRQVLVRLLLVSLLGVSLVGCGQLQRLLVEGLDQAIPQARMPTLQYEGARLVQAPGQRELAAWYCPRVLADQLGLAGASRLLCRQLFGAEPPADRLQVAFELDFRAHNPNSFPVPMAELLTAVTVFPGKGERRLGAACVRLCGQDESTCGATPQQGQCVSKKEDIRSLSDFGGAAARFVVSRGIAAVAGEGLNFRGPRLVRDQELRFKSRFAFGPEQLLTVLVDVARTAEAQLRAGKAVSLEIPYRIEGTAWFDVGSLGRVAVGFGPASGVWRLPVERLVTATP